MHSVLFNFLGRDFFNALSQKDAERFTQMLFKWLGGIALGVPVFVYRDYLQASKATTLYRQPLKTSSLRAQRLGHRMSMPQYMLLNIFTEPCQTSQSLLAVPPVSGVEGLHDKEAD